MVILRNRVRSSHGLLRILGLAGRGGVCGDEAGQQVEGVVQDCPFRRGGQYGRTAFGRSSFFFGWECPETCTTRTFVLAPQVSTKVRDIGVNRECFRAVTCSAVPELPLSTQERDHLHSKRLTKKDCRPLKKLRRISKYQLDYRNLQE